MVRNKTFQEILAEKMAETSVAEAAPAAGAASFESPLSLLESLSPREIAPHLPSAWSRSAQSAYGVGRRRRGALWCLPSPRTAHSAPPKVARSQASQPGSQPLTELSPVGHFALEVFRRLGQELELPLTVARVKKAYRRLVQQHHPDRTANQNSSTEVFLRLQEAYQTLLAEFTPATSRSTDSASPAAA